jgi:hypothetical protein
MARTIAIVATYAALRQRAATVQELTAMRARRAFGAAFAPDGRPWSDGSCFHLAHNWRDLPELTPAQRRACRLVSYLERRQWDSYRILDRWTARRWTAAALRAEG